MSPLWGRVPEVEKLSIIPLARPQNVCNTVAPEAPNETPPMSLCNHDPYYVVSWTHISPSPVKPTTQLETTDSDPDVATWEVIPSAQKVVSCVR